MLFTDAKCCFFMYFKNAGRSAIYWKCSVKWLNDIIFLFFSFFFFHNTHVSGLVKCILPKFCNCSLNSTFCKMKLWFAFTNLHLQWKSDTVQHYKCLENWLYCQQLYAKMYKGFLKFVQNKQWASGTLWHQLFSIVSSIPKIPLYLT